MRTSRLLATTFAATATAFLAQPALAAEPSASADPEIAAVESLGSVPRGRLSDAVIPSAYKLDLSIDPAQETYSGHATIDVTIAAPSRYIDMHGLDFDMKQASVTVGGRTLTGRWTQLDDTGVARLVFREELPAGPARLDFSYSHEFSKGPAGVFRVKVGDDWFAWTQFESIDARQAFPSFDQPGFKVPFTVTLRTPRGMTAISNTLETAVADINDTTIHQFAPTKPLPTYLVAFMVGPFVQASGSIPATPQRHDPLPQRILTTPQNEGQTAFALDATSKIVSLLERYFGISYPYAKLDQITSPIMPGAMENAGAILYGENIILLDDNAATTRKRVAGMVMAHEIGHQWFGDLVTPEWWDDIWLNESFANWVGYYIADQWRPDLHVWEGALGEGFEAMDTDALIVGRPIRQPIETNGQIDSAFDSITYGKGGHVIAMIAGFMGEEKFRQGVRNHLNAHAFGNATGDDFFNALAAAAGDPRIVAAMKGFVQQQGVPLVTVSGAKGKYTVSQSRYARLGTAAPPTLWSVPVCMSRGAARNCKLLDGPSAQMTLGGSGPLLPNAGGTGYYRFELPTADWDALIARADTLKGGEAQAVADSLRASFLAGHASPEQLIALTRKLADNPDSYAFGEAGAVLGELDLGDALGKDGKAAFRALVDRIYAPKLAAIGFDPSRGAYSGADPEETALRDRLVRRLALAAEDPAVRQTLLKAAEAYLGGDTGALDPAFLAIALDVYVDEGDLARVQDLASRALASQDPMFRPYALGALAEKGDQEIATWLLDGLQDDRLRQTERLRLIIGVIRNEDTQDFGAEWLRANYHSLTESLGGIFLVNSVPIMLEGFCSNERADQFEGEFGKLVAGTPGELPFARTMEKVRDCAALTAARGAEMRQAVLAAQ